METLSTLIKNYVKLKWVLRCLFIGLVLASLAVGIEIYIRTEKGRVLDAHFFKGMGKGILAPLAIPIMIYTAVILLRVYLDLKRHGLELVSGFARSPKEFDVPLSAGEQIRVDSMNAFVVGTAGRRYITRVIITTHNLYLVSWMQILVDQQKGYPGLKGYWKGGHTCIPLPDVRAVHEKRKSGKMRFMYLEFNNGDHLELRVTAGAPLHIALGQLGTTSPSTPRFPARA
jgi:hypothetical protein